MKHFQIEKLSPLYEAVQSSGIFPDSKYFPDCTPRRSTRAILRDFEQEQKAGRFSLLRFVEANFDPPPQPENNYQSNQKPIKEHLQNLWQVLIRQPTNQPAHQSTLLQLPHPYIVPGGRFREIYYWDSYFTMLGLAESGRVDLIENMLENFAHLISTVGFVPNGNRTYYLGRSQPPFFGLMVEVLANCKSDTHDTYDKYHTYLLKENKFWNAGASQTTDENPAHRRVVRLPDGSRLNRFWDDRPAPRPEAYAEDLHIAEQSPERPAADVFRHIRAAAESGWDFSSRWFADGQDMATIETTDLIPVDLNCLLYFQEKFLAKNLARQGDSAAAKKMDRHAERRRQALLKFCWDDSAGFFFDYNFRTGRHTGRATLAAVFPLFFEMTTAEQAARVAHFLEKNFLAAGGVRTTLARTGQQWDAPNGWAPLQWMSYQAMKNYGHTALAAEIRRRWLATCEKTYSATGKMMEKYNVEDPDAAAGGGEYPNQDGFGWTNGVFLRLAAEQI